MPHAVTDDGVRLYFEETGSGQPVIFVHEFAGDLRSYEPQMRHFGKRYRAIAYNARGFPPSGCSGKCVLLFARARRRRHSRGARSRSLANAEGAYPVGLSMGGFATLHFGIRHHNRALSLCIGGCGYGVIRARQARDFSRRGRRDRGRSCGRTACKLSPSALRLRADPRAIWLQGPAGPRRVQEACLANIRRSDQATTQQGVQKERPSLYTLVDDMK